MVNATHDAVRGLKTPPPGVRPGSLSDPGPQRSDRTLRRSAGAGLPTLALPSLAGSAAEEVDSFSLRFLVAAALAARREEEAKKEALKVKEQESTAVHAEVQQQAAEMERARLLLERSKRKRKKAPKTSPGAR